MVPLLSLPLLAATAAADPVEVTVEARLDAAPDRVFATLADFDAWDRIFRGVQQLRVERSGNCARIRQATEQAGRTLAYTITATLHPESHRLEIALDPSEPHDLVLLESTWQVEAHARGGSRVALRVRTQSGVPLPAFVERLVVARSAQHSLDELARALDRVAAESPGSRI